MRISRHYSDHHFREDVFENRLAIYEDQIRGWFHDQARILEKASDHAGFVLLLVAVSYIEGFGVFWKGEDSKGRSTQFFRDAFREIMGEHDLRPDTPDNAIDEFYKRVRCGLFHLGITRREVVLSGDPREPVSMVLDPETGKVVQIRINPHRLLDVVEEHLSSYVMRLRDPKEVELRENFDRAWNLRIA